MTRQLITAALLAALGFAGLTFAEEKKQDDGFVSLFDGKSLAGWKVNENPESFRIEDGCIIANGQRSHLFYVGDVNGGQFKNFELKMEVKNWERSNSGVYFATQYQESGWPDKGYEAQVNNTHGDPKKTGGLYGIKDVMNNSPAKDGEWWEYDIKVEGKHITLKVNGKVTTDYVEPENPERPANFKGRLLAKGTFALQGHDPGSKVAYRNIRVKVLPD